MTDDFGRLFGALAIKRGLVSPQQVAGLLKRVDESQSLDAQMVRAGWVTASVRLEILSEMDSQVLAASGDVESAVRSVRDQSAEVDEFISLYDSSVRPASKSSGQTDEQDGSLEETFVRPATDKVAANGKGKLSTNSESADNSGNDAQAPLSETVISQAPPKSDEEVLRGDESNPLDGTLIYQAPSDLLP